MKDGAAPRAAGTRTRTRAAAVASPSRRNITASLDADRKIYPAAPKTFPRDENRDEEQAEKRGIPGKMCGADRASAPGHRVDPVERAAASPPEADRLPVRLHHEVPQRRLILPLRPGDSDAVRNA